MNIKLPSNVLLFNNKVFPYSIPKIAANESEIERIIIETITMSFGKINEINVNDKSIYVAPINVFCS